MEIKENPEEFCAALGLSSKAFIGDRRIFYTPIEASKDAINNLALQTPALYVYSDVVEYQIVGDVRAPLLRTVPVKGEREKPQHVEFHHKIWIPLNKGYISSIEIKICNDAGELIIFPAGKVTLILHFKRLTPL